MSSKVRYFVLLFILIYKAWGLRPIGDMNTDVVFAITLLLMLYGYFHFNKSEELSLKDRRLKKYWWIVAGIILSMIPCYLYYGQSFLQSFITYRFQLTWLVVPVLFKVAPSDKELVKAITITVCFKALVSVIWVIMPDLILREIPEDLGFTEEDFDVESDVLGVTLVLIPILYYLGKIHIDFKLKYLVPVLLCYIYVFFISNRSSLFTITAIIIYSLFKLKSRNKTGLIIVFGIILLLAAILTQSKWNELFEETNSQVNDSDYNRNIALLYFLTQANPSWVTYILGNGFLSAHAGADVIEMQKSLGAHATDIGLIGHWNYFGILPLIAIVSCLIYPIRHKMPFFLRIWALEIIGCSLTLSVFVTPTEILYFSLYYYFLHYYRVPQSEYIRPASDKVSASFQAD